MPNGRLMSGNYESWLSAADMQPTACSKPRVPAYMTQLDIRDIDIIQRHWNHDRHQGRLDSVRHRGPITCLPASSVTCRNKYMLTAFNFDYYTFSLNTENKFCAWWQVVHTHRRNEMFDIN